MSLQDFYSKTNQMHQCPKFILFWNNSTCFRRSFRPSSGFHDCTYSNKLMSNRYCYCLLASRQQYLFDVCLLLYVQSWTPDDGWKDRPKHIELFQNKINLGHWCIWLVLLQKYITMQGPMNVRFAARYFVCHSVTLSKEKLVSGVCLHFYYTIIPMTALQLIMDISTKLSNWTFSRSFLIYFSHFW